MAKWRRHFRQRHFREDKISTRHFRRSHIRGDIFVITREDEDVEGDGGYEEAIGDAGEGVGGAASARGGRERKGGKA